MRKRVLIIATSIKTKGGITSVIKAYKQTSLWIDWNCYWLATHIDKNKFVKILFFLFSLIKFCFLLPFYSIIHIHFSEPASAARKLIFVYISKIFGKKIITHFHSFSIETTINSKYQKLYYAIFFSSDQIVVLSDQWKKWIKNKWPNIEQRIRVIYNPCPLSEIKESFNKKTKTIIYAGILNQRKGYSDLIKAFALIAKSKRDWKIIFAGNGEIEKAKLLANDYQIEDQVIFMGWIIGEQKDKLFRDASIFCLPSYAEGFPMAVLDAFSYGLPVITTPVGGLPDILSDKKNALLVNPGDISALSDALELMIDDETLRNQISCESKRLSQTIFSLVNISDQLDNLYYELSHS
ncbi:MAG: glycosyltransferase family 4 protein [Prolixibacteraceae bacterium]|nr:glycosyltransferase family 4 protein [Prolixibacteraceae bacterium]